MLIGILGEGSGGQSDTKKYMHLVVRIKCYNKFMLQCSLALAITVTACPLSATHVQNRGRSKLPKY